MRFECVCEAETGYVCHMELYSGTGDNTVIALVSRILEPFSHNNHRVFMDRRYSSPTLFKKLLEMGFYPVGTVMSNRKHLPAEFKTSKLKKGERIAKRCEGMLTTKWKDKRDVFMISTVDPDTMVDTANERARHHDHEILKPASVINYNKHKAGVDKQDQMASYYPFQRKTVKWWKKMFFHLFEMGIINAHKLYKINNPDKRVSLRDFLITLAEELPAQLDENPLPPPAAMEPNRHQEGKGHFPTAIPATENKAKPYRKCAHCSNKPDPNGKKPRRETRWLCLVCQVPLCVECFLPYHNPHRRPALD